MILYRRNLCEMKWQIFFFVFFGAIAKLNLKLRGCAVIQALLYGYLAQPFSSWRGRGSKDFALRGGRAKDLYL